ncbi:hypothetical protein [Paenibacillus sp. JJ-223]|uniref:hypothetical protein n=1 Tax=Paenibacillus sp. JJ-223 TaxID=2905647 RepID=UPI001F33B1EC|nr:hypothetical protein [Paenibacillus sp. JJ-223]CAH1207444.1 hypothetical protein PAECIP111890_03024 [Paenibacillus sp. JJ-223]
MAWNIGLLCIQAELNDVDQILDIFHKSEEGLYFEDVTSVNMGDALGVGIHDSWVIIVDTQGRFIYDEKFPLQLSERYKVKTFWIAEGLVYRDYDDNGGKNTEVRGIDEGLKYLHSKGIKPIDEWGETIIFQILENEIFDIKMEQHGTTLHRLRYLKYEC